MHIHVNGIAVWTPGMTSWSQAQSILQGATSFASQPTAWPVPAVLPPAERRRAPATVKLAVQVASEACAMAQADAPQLPCVFASSHGDTEISDYMCAELAQAQPALSPTRFHNSVHNAASGYWTIAVGCMQPANAISAGADTFANGLLEAAALTLDAGQSLLVAYDMAAPAKLLPLCPIHQSFAVALVLSHECTPHSLARLTLTDAPATTASLPAWADELMRSSPAAQSLPLLQALAQRIPAAFAVGGQQWNSTPCT